MNFLESLVAVQIAGKKKIAFNVLIGIMVTGVQCSLFTLCTGSTTVHCISLISDNKSQYHLLQNPLTCTMVVTIVSTASTAIHLPDTEDTTNCTVTLAHNFPIMPHFPWQHFLSMQCVCYAMWVTEILPQSDSPQCNEKERERESYIYIIITIIIFLFIFYLFYLFIFPRMQSASAILYFVL